MLNSDLYEYPALYDALLPVSAHLPYYVELSRQTLRQTYRAMFWNWHAGQGS